MDGLAGAVHAVLSVAVERERGRTQGGRVGLAVRTPATRVGRPVVRGRILRDLAALLIALTCPGCGEFWTERAGWYICETCGTGLLAGPVGRPGAAGGDPSSAA